MSLETYQIEELKGGVRLRNYVIRSFILLTAILLFLLGLSINSGYTLLTSLGIGCFLLIVQVSIWSCS